MSNVNSVQILSFSTIGIMISHEWIEGTKLHPSCAQFFSGITSKTTDISANMCNTEHIEAHNG